MFQDQANREGDGCTSACLCICECLIGCIESLMEYFNKWAFTYVAIYGDDFASAGRAALRLFNNRGWENIIADNLCAIALTYTSIALSGMVCCALLVTSWFFPMPAPGLFIVVAFIATYLLCSCVISVLDSGVVTVLVCFAEDPRPFKKAHPKEFNDLMGTWLGVYADEMRRCKYHTL